MKYFTFYEVQVIERYVRGLEMGRGRGGSRYNTVNISALLQLQWTHQTSEHQSQKLASRGTCQTHAESNQYKRSDTCSLGHAIGSHAQQSVMQTSKTCSQAAQASKLALSCEGPASTLQASAESTLSTPQALQYNIQAL